jgi:hypothetical protein
MWLITSPSRADHSRRLNGQEGRGGQAENHFAKASNTTLRHYQLLAILRTMRKRFKQQPYDLVIVEWLDATRLMHWEAIDDMQKPAPVLAYSVGWLVRKTKAAVLIVSHITHPDGLAIHQGCGGMSIPKCSIVKVKVIAKAR